MSNKIGQEQCSGSQREAVKFSDVESSIWCGTDGGLVIRVLRVKKKMENSGVMVRSIIHGN